MILSRVSLNERRNSTSRSTFRCEGLMVCLLGTAAPSTPRERFSRLSDGGRTVDDLQTPPWAASVGHVIDRYGLRWLIGFEDDESH
jgi:PhnB protein